MAIFLVFFTKKLQRFNHKNKNVFVKTNQEYGHTINLCFSLITIGLYFALYMRQQVKIALHPSTLASGSTGEIYIQLHQCCFLEGGQTSILMELYFQNCKI